MEYHPWITGKVWNQMCVRERKRDGKIRKKWKAKGKRNSRITPIKYTWRTNERTNESSTFCWNFSFLFISSSRTHWSSIKANDTKPQRNVTILLLLRWERARAREREKPSARDVMHGDSQKLKLYDYFDIVHHKLLAPIINLNGSYSKAFLSRRYQITPPQIHTWVCVWAP